MGTTYERLYEIMGTTYKILYEILYEIIYGSQETNWLSINKQANKRLQFHIGCVVVITKLTIVLRKYKLEWICILEETIENTTMRIVNFVRCIYKIIRFSQVENSYDL